MPISKKHYEAPAIRGSANLIASTENRLIRAVESDFTGRDPFGAVGFGV
jgi:hypothetical protein